MTPDTSHLLTKRLLPQQSVSHAVPSPADRHLWQITPVRDLLWGGGILAILWFGYYLRGVFTPVLIALLMAYLFQSRDSASGSSVAYPQTHDDRPHPLWIGAAAAGTHDLVGSITGRAGAVIRRARTGYLQRLAQRYHGNSETCRIISRHRDQFERRSAFDVTARVLRAQARHSACWEP